MIRQVILFSFLGNHCYTSWLLSLCLMIALISTSLLANSVQNNDIRPEDLAFSLFKLGQEYQYYNRCDIEKLSSSQCNSHIIESYESSRRHVKLCKEVILTFNYLGMLNDLAVYHLREGTLLEARTALLDVLAIDENHLNALSNLAHIEAIIGEVALADGHYQKALSLAPNEPVLLYNYGVFLYSHGKMISKGDLSKQITSLWLAASNLSSTLHNAYVNLAVQACTANDREGTAKYYEAALERTHSNTDLGVHWSVIMQVISSLVPMIPGSKNDLLSTRLEYISSLDEFSLNVPYDVYSQDLTEIIGCGAIGYYLAYHGFEDILPRQLYARSLYRIAKSQLQYTAPFLLDNLQKQQQIENNLALNVKYILDNKYIFNKENYPIPSPFLDSSSISKSKLGAKIKVGFISAFFVHHSVGLLLRGVVKRLNRDIFDVVVFLVGKDSSVDRSHDYVLKDFSSISGSSSTGSSSSSSSSDSSKQSMPSFRDLRGYSMHRTRAAIAALELDILIFGEVGMDHTTYFASFARLARRSASFWGHAITSGVSGRLFNSFYMSDTDVNSSLSSSSSSSSSSTNDTERRERGSVAEANYGGVDYFISSVLFEADIKTCQFEYTEKLLLHSGLSTFFEWPLPPLHRHELKSSSSSSPSSSSSSPSADVSVMNASLIPICSHEYAGSNCHKLIKFPASRLLQLDADITIIADDVLDIVLTEGVREGALVQWELPTKRSFLCHILPSFCIDIWPNPDAPFVFISIPQTLYKFHVDFDWILLDILTRTASVTSNNNNNSNSNSSSNSSNSNGNSSNNSDIFIAFIKMSAETYNVVSKRLEASWNCRFRQSSSNVNVNVSGSSSSGDRNFQRASTPMTPCDRILWLPFLAERDFLTLAAVSDFVLDSFPLGGGRSSLEILSTATPIISIFPRKEETSSSSSSSSPDNVAVGNRANYVEGGKPTPISGLSSSLGDENGSSGRISSSSADIYKSSNDSRSRSRNGSKREERHEYYSSEMNLGASPTILQLTWGMYKSMKLSFVIHVDHHDNPLKVSNSLEKTLILVGNDKTGAVDASITGTISCCVAKTVSEYVRLAVILTKSAMLRLFLVNEIQSAIVSPRSVFEDIRVVHEWEYSLLYMIQQPRPVPDVLISGKDLALHICNSSNNNSDIDDEKNLLFSEENIPDEKNILPEHLREPLSRISGQDVDLYRSMCTTARSDYRWNYAEFEKTVFSHIHPIILKDTIVQTNNIAATAANAAAPAVEDDLSSLIHDEKARDSNGFSDNSAVFSKLFVSLMAYVDRDASLRAKSDRGFSFNYLSEGKKDRTIIEKSQILVNANADWLFSCLNSHESDRLKLFFSCLMIAFEYERTSFPLMTNINLNYETSAGDSVVTDLPIYQLVDASIISRGLREFESYFDSSSSSSSNGKGATSEDRSCRLFEGVTQAIAQESGGLPLGSPGLVLTRRVVGRKMVCEIMSLSHSSSNNNSSSSSDGSDDSSDMSEEQQLLHSRIYPTRKDLLASAFDRTTYDDCIDLIKADLLLLLPPPPSPPPLSSSSSSSSPAMPNNDRPTTATTATATIRGRKNSGSSGSRKSFQTEGITIGITTSRRLSYFLATIEALLKGVGGDIPNSFIQQVIIVDDLSSVEDRITMMRLFPRFTFVLKSGEENDRGHANSLNLLLKLVKSRYFIYLEDDWVLVPTITMMDNLLEKTVQPIMDIITASATKDYDSNVHANDDFSSKYPTSCVFLPPFTPILVASMAVLGFQGDLAIPLYFDKDYDPIGQQCGNSGSNRFPGLIAKYVNITIDKGIENILAAEKIHVLLFNDQTSRDSAEVRFDLDSIFDLDSMGDASGGGGGATKIPTYAAIPSGLEGNLKLIGTGGWDRSSMCNIGQKPSFSTSTKVSTHTNGRFKSLEEEEVMLGRRQKILLSYVYHEFGFIPHKGGTCRLHDNNDNNNQRTNDFAYWPSLSLNPGLWDLDEVKMRMEKMTGSSNIFYETDLSFERRFSTTSYSAGLNLGYLPALVFKHIGKDSAYAKNGIKREWEK